MAVAAYSAITQIPVACDVAMTGELSVRGKVLPVGGVPEKMQAAIKAGLKRVLIPAANDQQRYRELEAEIIPVDDVHQALELALGVRGAELAEPRHVPALAAEAGNK